MENQTKFWLPLNSITEQLFYTNDDGDNKNQRVVISAPTEHPVVWQISKIESAEPVGVQKITLAQDRWNPKTDYIDKSDSTDIYAMYADYYSSSATPLTGEPSGLSRSYALTTRTNDIRVGGSYKKLSFRVYDKDGVDITDSDSTEYTISSWLVTMDGTDITDSDLISIINPDGETLKVKFLGGREYLTKTITVECVVNNDPAISASIELEITAL